MSRYSPQGREKIRLGNYKRWLEASKNRWGNKFSYEPSEDSYKAQKKPVKIKCPTHGEFVTTPAKHLMQKGGGCEKCGKLEKSFAAINRYRDDWDEWVQSSFPDHLKLLGDFNSGQDEVSVKCKIHGSTKITTLDYLKNNKTYGCDACARENMVNARRLDLKQITERLIDLPKSLKITGLRRTDGSLRVVAECANHGEFESTLGVFENGRYICPKCAAESRGYAHQKLERLIELDEKGDKTWIAVMTIEALGITTLKVGVTTRTLEERYKSSLKKIHKAIQIDEIDAYVIESKLLRMFSDYQDKRIMFKGMRSGERWSGDTELIFESQKQKLLNAFNKLIKELDTGVFDYKNELDRIKENVRIDEDVSREKSLDNLPIAIVGILPETSEVIVEFDSLAEAQRAGYRNLSRIINSNDGQKSSGGLWWLKKSDYEENGLASLEGLKKIGDRTFSKNSQPGSPVLCRERNQHFHSAGDAARFLNDSGIPCSPSHITSVCKGRRPIACGYTWAYSSLNHNEVDELDGSEIRDVKPKMASNLPKKILAFDTETHEEVGTFNSQSEAAKYFGLSGASVVSGSIKNHRPVQAKGVYFQIKDDDENN